MKTALRALPALASLWIVVPPVTLPLLIAADLAIECSPLLLIAAMVALVLEVRPFARSPRPHASALRLFLVAVSVLLSALPAAALLHADPRAAAAALHGPNPHEAALREVAIGTRLGPERGTIRAYLPASPHPLPMVFAIYGGAWQRGSSAEDSVLNRALARRGYAVFALEYRHAPRYRFPAALDDIATEIAALKRTARTYNADPARTAILGHSSGGELAFLTAFRPKSAFRALVSYSGAIELIKGYEYPPQPDPIGVRSVIGAYMGGAPGTVPTRYRAASPLLHVRRGLPPALLIYGDRDHVVDVRFAVEMQRRLAATGNEVTLLRLPWADHAFERVYFGLHAHVAFAAVDDFLRRTLSPERQR